MGNHKSKAQQQTKKPVREWKLVMVGDNAVGKSCVIATYLNRFPNGYEPTVFEYYKTHETINGEKIEFSMWDTAGKVEYSRLRILSYPETDLFVICFSVTNSASFDNVRSKWLPEIKREAPNADILLLGTKQDLRTDEETIGNLAESGMKVVEWADAQNLAESIEAIGYMECSAKEDSHSVEKVFEQIACYFDSPKEGEPFRIALPISGAKSARK